MAYILESWQACRNNGETPDLIELAGGDAALAEEARQLIDMVGAIDTSGFASLGAEPPEAAAAVANLPSVPDFEILGELGRGGMGVVYEARQMSLDRIVALKLLPLGTVDRAAAERFAREAATAAGLRHPNIVPIYATGEAPGTLWYAMPKIEGQSLAQSIAKQPEGIAWRRVVEIGIVAAEALRYAHGQGIVHRDVKPANLLEDTAGQIWLTDFGVARRNADAGATLSQAICGTPRYMSPEQIAGDGEPIDHRTDLYSLGATLYELATGRAVVASTAPLDVLQEVRHGEPLAPRSINPRLPRAWEVVLLKCLEKSPRDRYATAADLIVDLKALADGRPIAARGLPVWTVWQRRLARHAGRVRLAALAATVAIAVVGGATLAYQYYVLSRQAQVQISSAGGAHEAAIRKAPVDGESDGSVTPLALPMRQPLAMEAGDYEIAFASRGRYGERARLQLDAGDVATPRYIDRRPTPPSVDIDGMWVSEIEGVPQDSAPNDRRQSWGGLPGRQRQSEGLEGRPTRNSVEEAYELYFCTLSDRQFAIYAEGGRECFHWAVGVPPALNNAGETPAPQVTPTDPRAAAALDQLATTAELFKYVDFTYQTDAPFTGKRLAQRPYLARPERLMPSAVDLNQDGEVDFVIAARLEPIVAALDHRGRLLWASRVDVSVPSDAPPPWVGADQKPVERPSVIQMLPVRDQTGDGIRDVLVVSMAVRSPPAAYPQTTLLSGHDGAQVWTTPLACITAPDGSRWPMNGILEFRSREVDEIRFPRPLLATNGVDVIRNLVSEDRRLRWVGLPLGLVPVTPPVELSHDAAQAVVVTAANEMRVLDLGTGRVGEPIRSAQPAAVLAASPRMIRRGAGKPPGILATYYENLPGPRAGEQFAMYAPESLTPLWIKSLDIKTDVVSEGREQRDFPLIADLDHDGDDEIVVAVSVGYQTKQIRCLDALAGDDCWPRPMRMRCAEALPERVCLVGDLDADGVDDLAIASLHGEAKRDSAEAMHVQRANVSVYIDVVSGGDGRRLTVAHQEIGEVDQFTRAVEIDALRCTAPGSVEVSLVWGEARERTLESLSVRFSLTRDELPLLAPGVTALTRRSPSGGGFYLQRPGPDELGGETAVWLEPDSGGLLVAGYQRVLAHWQNDRGAPHVLLQDRAMTRLAGVDVPSGRVLWTRDTAGSITLARHVRQASRDCILTQTFDPTSSACRLTCLDAESGQVAATLDFVFDRMYDAALCADNSNDVFLVTGPAGRLALASGTSSYQVRKVALGRRHIVWKRDLLSRTSFNTDPPRPLKMLVDDVDGDGAFDCIVPDEGRGNAVRLVALSGQDGRELWSCETGLTTDQWPGPTTWPMMEIARSDAGKTHLVFVDQREPDQILVRLLLLADGRELDSRAYIGKAMGLSYVANLLGLSLRVDRAGAAAPTIVAVVPEWDTKGRVDIECSRFQIREDRLCEIASERYHTGGRDVRIQVVASDAAASLDRIVLARESPTSFSLARYSGDGDTAVWRRTVQTGANSRPITTADAKFMILRADESDALIDVTTGQNICDIPRMMSDWPEVAADGPIVLMSGDSPHLVYQQPDGVRISSPAVETELAAKTSAGLKTRATLIPPAGAMLRHDPRQWRNPVGSPLNMADRTLANLVANWTRAGVQSLFAFVIPLAGAYWLIQKRRFSLAQLSLAPLAALACLMTWKTMLTEVAPVGRAGQEPWFVVLFSGTMVVAAAAFVARCVVRRQIGLLARMMTLAASFTAAVQFIPALLATDDVHYRLGWDHFLAGALVAFIALLPPALVVWGIVSAIARRWAPRGATTACARK